MKYGSPEHHAHIRSARWRWLVEERKSKVGHKCEVCGFRKYLQGHHVTYERLGCERIGDIRIVCRACHWRITQLHRSGWPIPKATRYVIRTTKRRIKWKRRWQRIKRRQLRTLFGSNP